MSRKNDTRRWLDSHRRDPWVRAAQADNYRSRAAFKLAQIDDRDRLLRPGIVVVDLGATPGGWSQYCARKLDRRGRIIALDRLPMEPIDGVEFLQLDFTQDAGLATLREHLGGAAVDLVLSDMAPNLTGVAVADQMKVMHLAELSLAFCDESLKPGGHLVVKVFQGEGFDEFLRDMRGRFRSVAVRKPEASRDASREMYLVGRDWRD